MIMSYPIIPSLGSTIKLSIFCIQIASVDLMNFNRYFIGDSGYHHDLISRHPVAMQLVDGQRVELSMRTDGILPSTMGFEGI